jgi:hypothetical protein
MPAHAGILDLHLSAPLFRPTLAYYLNRLNGNFWISPVLAKSKSTGCLIMRPTKVENSVLIILDGA